MRSEDNSRRGSRPPPPRPPARADRPEPDDGPNRFPTILRITLVALTCVGILFAIRAISTRSREMQTPSVGSTNNLAGGPKVTEEAADAGPIALRPTNSESSVESPDTNMSTPPPSNIGTGSTQEKTDRPHVRVAGLDPELGNIERDLDAQLAMPDTTVYLRISDNIRQCLHVQLAILKSATGTKRVNAECESIQKRLDTLQQLDDAPYYSLMIAGYSLLMAEASVTTCALLRGDTDAVLCQRLDSELATIRRSPLEGTCDATFVTADALFSAAKAQERSAVGSLVWSEIERNMRTQRTSEQHIVRKTEAAHRTFCDVLERCIRTWDQTGKSADTVARIERDRDGNISKAKDSYFRVAAYTEAEARLMVLWARSLQR